MSINCPPLSINAHQYPLMSTNVVLIPINIQIMPTNAAYLYTAMPSSVHLSTLTIDYLLLKVSIYSSSFKFFKIFCIFLFFSSLSSENELHRSSYHWKKRWKDIFVRDIRDRSKYKYFKRYLRHACLKDFTKRYLRLYDILKKMTLKNLPKDI